MREIALKMRQIALITIDGDRHVSYNGRTLRVFSKYDDFAFTEARKYAEYLKKLDDKSFKELYPEHFL